MMGDRPYDVCIIGGGLVGLFSALFLVQRGGRVVLLEKGECGREASSLNFGNMRLQGRNPAEYPLALSAHDLWERFEAITGESCAIERCGQAYIALAPDQHARLQQIAAQANAAGINVDLLDDREVRRLWPALSPLASSATWSPRDAVSEPPDATAAVVRAVRRAGVDIREGWTVVSIDRSSRGLEVNSNDGHSITSRHVVNAAGAWAGRLSATLGEPVPMFAAGPQLVLTSPAANLYLPSMLAADGSIIFRQRPDGRVLTTMFPRQPGDLENGMPPIAPAQIERTLRRLAEVVPALGNVNVERAWSGVEGYLPDMLPVLSPSRTTEGVFHAFGFSGHGYQLAPGVGRAVADLITAGTTGVPIAAFDIARYNGKVVPNERIEWEFEITQAARMTQNGRP